MRSTPRTDRVGTRAFARLPRTSHGKSATSREKCEYLRRFAALCMGEGPEYTWPPATEVTTSMTRSRT